MNYARTALLLALMSAILIAAGFALGGQQGALLALALSAAMNLFAFWQSDSLVLRMHNAREIQREDAPDYHSLVAGLAREAGLPMPRLYLIESAQPNAFATGRSAQRGAVAVTRGLLRLLNRDELAGVVAHELAHIQNRDTLIMSIAATIAGAISMLAQFALFFGGRDGERRGGVLGALLVALLAPLAAMLVQMAISRTREYAADRRGAEISRKPLGLASALEKIALGAKGHAMASAERNPASAHLFIMNPLSSGGLAGLFSTHPDPALRIKALQAMAGGMPLASPSGERPGTSVVRAGRAPVPTVRRRGSGRARNPWR